MKILLLQDTTARGELRLSLTGRGHQISCAANWAEATALARAEEFPLILLDLVGLTEEAVSFCRSRGTLGMCRDSWLMVILPAERPPQAPALRAAGIDDILLKPYPLDFLDLKLALVERHFQARLEPRRTEQALNARAQQQVAIAALGQCAVTEELATVANLVSPFVMHTLEVEFCRILELQPDGKTMAFLAGFGWRDRQDEQAVPPSDTLTGRTLSGEDLIIEELTRDPRFAAPDTFLLEHGVVSGISVAIKGNKTVLGLLGAYTGQKRVFSESDMRFLEGLANVLGAAVESKRSEAELQRHQAQLQHLQRLESVGQLAAGLAHDYNNVLTIIHGHLTLVLGDPQVPAKIAGSVKTALSAVERAAGLTRQLLTFSRKQSIHREPADVNAVIANVTKLLDRVLGEHVRLEFAPQENLPAIQADVGMLDQVFMNLAVNARDAMPSGGTLRMSTSVVQLDALRAKGHAGAREGAFVCVQVADTGCGMDEETLRRIFEPFFTTKGPGKGTGLGLATVYGIVKQHEGWIQVESKPGKGTIFLIFFPTLGKSLAKATGIDPLKEGNEPKTILLVEDEPSLRDLARLLLEDSGYRVVSAGSGAEALKAWTANQHSIAVLLTDLVLPDGLTGFELAERLQGRQPALKVLFTSGYAAEEVRQRFAGRHEFHFIQKPYRSDTLAQAIAQCLTGSVGPPSP